MRISRELPTIADASCEPLWPPSCGRAGCGRVAIDHWLVQPGGRGIVEGVQRGLGLPTSRWPRASDVLADLGNVGTPASLFVLERTLAERRPAPGELGLMVTIGPGVTVGLMLLGLLES